MTNVAIIVLQLFFSGWVQATSERRIPKELVEEQRRYSSEVIYEMIKYAKVDGRDCNVMPEMISISFNINQGEYDFAYANTVYGNNNDRELSSYDCLLSVDRRRLECERRLPGAAAGLSTEDYIYTTIHLDESGQATSMEGRLVRRPIKGLFNFLARKKVLTKFSCVIEPPAKVSKKEINNKERSPALKKSPQGSGTPLSRGSGTLEK